MRLDKASGVGACYEYDAVGVHRDSMPKMPSEEDVSLSEPYPTDTTWYISLVPVYGGSIPGEEYTRLCKPFICKRHDEACNDMCHTSDFADPGYGDCELYLATCLAACAAGFTACMADGGDFPEVWIPSKRTDPW